MTSISDQRNYKIFASEKTEPAVFNLSYKFGFDFKFTGKFRGIRNIILIYKSILVSVYLWTHLAALVPSVSNTLNIFDFISILKTY